MLKYGKRILTVLLALVMAVGFCGLLANPAQAAQSSKVVSQQVSLGDDLTMNFAVRVAPDNQDGTLTVSVAGEEVGSYAVSSMTPDENGHYCVSAELAAAQMTDTVNLTLTDGKTVFSKDYSVRSYALALLDEKGGFSDAVKTMAKAMLNYGAAAQVYFEHNTEKLANDGYFTENNVDLSAVEAPAVETSGKVEGLAFYGASLVFRGKVALRYYFDAPNGVDSFTFSAGDKTYEAKEKGDYYYIEIPGITPENYGKAVTVTAGTVDDTISVSYSPMTYLVRMYSKTGNENLKALVQNMYSYHTSAVEYIAQTEQDSEVELPYSPAFYSMYQYEEFIGNVNPVSLGTLFGTDDEVNENAVIEVSVETVTGTASGVYTPAYNAAEWFSGAIQFAGTGKVKITLNNVSVELTVENTSYSYPYNHNEPQFYSMVNSEYRYIGNSTISLGRLFMLSGSTVDEASVIELKVVIPEGSNATVDYPQFKATEWEYTNVTFGGTGVVQLQLNNAYLELEVEDTTLDYPYMHNTPSFQPVDMTKNRIGNATVYLDKLFETYSEVNEASVITVDIQTMSDTVSAEYIPAEKPYDWKSGAIVFSGTGDVQISINGTSLWLTVENTAFDYPYTYNYPVFFSKVADSDHYIGANNEVSLSKLFEADPMFTFNEFSVVDLHVEASEGVTVREIPEFAPADWANVTLWFEGEGAVDITLNGATVHLTVEPNGVDVPYVRPAFSVKEEYADGNYCIGNQGISLGAVFTVDGELADDAVILISLNYADGNVGAITLGGDTAQDWQNYRLPTGNEYLGKVTITVNGASIELTVENSDIVNPYNRPDFTCELDSAKTYYIGNETNLALSRLFTCTQSMDYKSVFKVAVTYPDGTTETKYWTNATDNGWEYHSVYTGEAAGELKISVNGCEAPVLIVENTDFTTPYVRPELTPAIEPTGLYIGKDVQVSLNSLYNTDSVDSTNAVFEVCLAYANGEKTTVFAQEHTDGSWGNYPLTFAYEGEVTVTVNGKSAITLTVDNSGYNVPYVPAVEKFDIVFKNTDRYMYRVGNSNNVVLSYLFAEKAADTVVDSGVTVSVETIEGQVSGVHTNNATDWTQGYLKFTGTGVVKLTVTDQNNCLATELYLEVVDGKNITTAAGSLDGTDVVLLSDVKVASGETATYWNCTVYGNGFTFDVRGGMNQYNSKQGHGIIITKGVTLDNLVVIGDVYDTYGAYTNQEDYTAAIDATNTIIQNCYIANCSAPVKSKGNNTIIDSTLYGGTVANLIIEDGVNTLTNVTTVNYNDAERDVIGFGVLVSTEATDNVKLVLNGTFKQHNFVCATDADSIADANAKTLFNTMFESTYSAYHIAGDPVYVNPGILSMKESFDISDITDNTGNGYIGTSVSYKVLNQTYNGYLYSLPGSGNTVDNGYSAEADVHKATVQGDYLPKFGADEFSLGDQEISYDGESDNRYLHGDYTAVEAMYTSGEEPLTLDLTKLVSIDKYEGVVYSASARCLDADGNALAAENGVVTLEESGSYILEFSIVDNIFYNAKGEKLDKSVTRIYQVPLTLSVKEASIPDAVITITKTAPEGDYVTSGLDKKITFNPLSAITITDTEGTVDLTKNISSKEITYASNNNAFAGATTIKVTYTDNRVLTIVLGKPSLNSPGSSKLITYANDGTVTSDAAVKGSSATGGTWPVTSYSFKGTNQNTVSVNETIIFTIPDKSTNSCVTADTLITLADGTQKRVDEVTYDDILLTWDFETGTYAAAPAILIDYHGDDNYRILRLNFSDGTTVKVINEHGFFNAEQNNFVYISEENVEQFLGDRFVQHCGDSYTMVTLDSYEITQEYTGNYSIQSAVYNNTIVGNMFSMTTPDFDGWFDYFNISDDMKYDEAHKQAEIEKYGLSTYEEWADLVTYEQFVAFNGQYMNILIGRGTITKENICWLINRYLNP